MSKARRKFTRIMLLAVSAIGLLSAILLLTDPPPQSNIEAGSGLFGGSAAVAAQRSIASVATQADALLDMKCDESNQILETASPRFRIKGPVCVSKDVEITSTKVLNKTNGYVATVFRQSTLFTTDYINLKEGKNEINVKFDTASGPVEKTLTVLRAPAGKK